MPGHLQRVGLDLNLLLQTAGDGHSGHTLLGQEAGLDHFVRNLVLLLERLRPTHRDVHDGKSIEVRFPYRGGLSIIGQCHVIQCPFHVNCGLIAIDTGLKNCQDHPHTFLGGRFHVVEP